jgi:ornithine cyclodeaminase/alanine dehydrogenase
MRRVFYPPTMNSTAFISDEHVRRTLRWPEVIEALRAAYLGLSDPASAPPRTVARRGRKWLRAMAAIPAGNRLMGAKLIARGPERGASHLIALWDQETAELVCLLDGKSITAMRTAGTSAVAVSALVARRDVRKMAVLGSGSEARAHVAAIASVMPLARIDVYSPTAANRQRFAAEYGDKLGIVCHAADDAESAVRGADLVVAAARSRDETPVLHGAWLDPGATVVSVGSTLPDQHEVDAATISRAKLVVSDVPEEVALETGDMIAARECGVAFQHKLVGLAALLQGTSTVSRDGGIALFKSVGAGLQDIAVASVCCREALKRGSYAELPMRVGPRDVSRGS